MPVFNEIASIIISRLARDPDPTTLETARKYIEKTKAFIEPVAKFVNNKESKDAFNLIGKFFSSLEEMSGSDDGVADKQAKVARDFLHTYLMKDLQN